MQRALDIDEDLLTEAMAVAESDSDSETIRLGLEALIWQDTYKRSRKLRESEPEAVGIASSARMDGALATERVLRRVWDRPEEDEACRDL